MPQFRLYPKLAILFTLVAASAVQVHAQPYPNKTEQVFGNSSDIFTPWQNLVRPTIRNPFCAFYRFIHSNGNDTLELKVSSGGVPFIMARNGKLLLELENDNVVTLYNNQYEKSCRGCGAVWKESDVHGATLRFPISTKDIDALCESYLGHIRLYMPDYTLGSLLTIRRTEAFRAEVEEFRSLIKAGH